MQDLTGQKFGRWTVTGFSHINKGRASVWSVICDCGNTGEVSRQPLRLGKSKSCGCLQRENGVKSGRSKFIDLTGQTFGLLTVVRLTTKREHGSCWFCKCECGRTTTTTISRLRSGLTKSCGCLKGRPVLPGQKAGKNAMISDYKREANLRGIHFKLSNQAFFQLVKLPCHYCGSLPARRYGTEDKGNLFEANGLDRVDSSLGYSPDNVVPCCKMCNLGKNSYSKEQFLQWVQRVYEHSFR